MDGRFRVVFLFSFSINPPVPHLHPFPLYSNLPPELRNQYLESIRWSVFHATTLLVVR